MRRRALSPLHVGLLIPWIVAVISARLPIRDNSFLWHVEAGVVQLNSGSVITSEPFSFTRSGVPWRTQSWLLEALYAWLEEAFGALVWVEVFVAGTALLLFALLFLIFRSNSVGLLGLVALSAASGWVAAPFLNPRPVVASYVFLALVVLTTQKRSIRWVLPGVGWIWGAVHASYPLAIAYLVVQAIRNRDRSFIHDAIALGVPALFTAHGWGAVDFVVEFVRQREALSLLTEWATPSLVSVEFALVIPSLIVLMYGFSTGRLERRDLWIVAFGILVMMSSARSILPAWILLSPLLGAAAADWTLRGRAVSSRTSPVVLGLALAVLILPFAMPIADEPLSTSKFPVEAMAHLDYSKRTFHDDVAGGYLIYAAWPAFEVFVDDRAEVFGVEIFTEVIETRSGTPTWSRVFEERGIEQALVRSEEGLVEALVRDGWATVHEDDSFSVLVPSPDS